MSAPLDRMFATSDLRAYPLAAMNVVMATRFAFLYARAGREVLPDLAVRLRSMRAAQAHQELIAVVERAWPETFMIRRPCCMAISPDEMLLAEVAQAALEGDRAGAMAAMRDMLPSLSRDRIFRHMVELVDAIRAVPVRQTGAAD